MTVCFIIVIKLLHKIDIIPLKSHRNPAIFSGNNIMEDKYMEVYLWKIS